jgi:two-component system chemotaxis sensor kinase CheA
VYIIIPKNMGLSFGILTYRIVDSLRRDVEMDTENICGDCILGSAIIDNNIILFPDIYAIREKQDPTVHNSHGNKKALGKNITCLLAEDTPFFRTIISSYLRDAGFIVDLANDGIEAKEKLSQNSDRYQLIISDIQMPRMDGLEFCRWIRSDQRFAKLPVMALTSLFSEKDQQKGYEAGFNRYEQKLNRDLLLTGINQLLEEFREGKV